MSDLFRLDKPTGKKVSVFDKLYFPKKPNYEYTSEFLASTHTAGLRHYGKINNGDNVERNVEISNYLARKQLAKTTKKLSVKRKEYEEKRDSVREQWIDLQQKESNFRDSFIRFNQFVKENQEKKDRATNKILEQIELKQERQSRTDELLEQSRHVSKVKAKMDANIAKYRIYEEFLLLVIENEESMQNINDLLGRYEALISARKDLDEMQQRDMMKLERAKSNLFGRNPTVVDQLHSTDAISHNEKQSGRLIESYSNKIATMNNHVNYLEEKYTKAKQTSETWERIRKHAKSEAIQRVIDSVAIKESCEKMYLEICQRKKLKPVHANDVEKQLLTIKQAIGEYEIINKRIRAIEEMAMRESQKAKASGSS